MEPGFVVADADAIAEEAGEDGFGEEGFAGAVGDDAALAHEDDAINFGRDVAEVMGDKDEAGALLDEGAEAFAEVALGGEVERVGGLVEEELAGAVDEGAGDEDAALFAGGHFANGVLGEVGGVDAGEGLDGALAHFVGDDEIGPEGGGGEEAGDDGIEADGATGGAAGGVGGARGEVHAGEIVTDDAEVLAEAGEVPTGTAEDADFHAGLDDGVEVAGHGADEGGLAAAVGAKDDDVLAGADGEVDVVEDDGVSEGDVDVGHGEEDVVLLRLGGLGGCGHLIC